MAVAVRDAAFLRVADAVDPAVVEVIPEQQPHARRHLRQLVRHQARHGLRIISGQAASAESALERTLAFAICTSL
eukprot:COSAG04_NODE_209_length_20232_cov_116.817315_9_plen_75_part_00